AVARKSGDGAHTDALRRLARTRKPRIAERRLDPRATVGKKGELLARDADDVGVDIVETIDILWPSVGRDRPGAKADDANPHRVVLLGADRGGDARRFGVVGGRRAAPRLAHVLLAMHDRAVHQAPQVRIVAQLAIL